MKSLAAACGTVCFLLTILTGTPQADALRCVTCAYVETLDGQPYVDRSGSEVVTPSPSAADCWSDPSKYPSEECDTDRDDTVVRCVKANLLISPAPPQDRGVTIRHQYRRCAYLSSIDDPGDGKVSSSDVTRIFGKGTSGEGYLCSTDCCNGATSGVTTSGECKDNSATSLQISSVWCALLIFAVSMLK